MQLRERNIVLIVADENIPYVREAFAVLSDVCLVHGRNLTSEIVKDADVLLVRSVTKVNADLLEGSRVQFVGTATIGTDHIDLDYLNRKGIAFASAPGSNATSVAEYVTAALLTIADRRGISLNGKSVGIIGVGNVGSRVRARVEALGMKAICNDPPLARETGDPQFRPLAEALEADVVTLHVPLTREGPDATFHLADGAFFGKLRPGAMVTIVRAISTLSVSVPIFKNEICRGSDQHTTPTPLSPTRLCHAPTVS